MVKSVTTVAKLIGSIRPFLIRRFSTRMGMCCIKGCTDITRSGSYLANLHEYTSFALVWRCEFTLMNNTYCPLWLVGIRQLRCRNSMLQKAKVTIKA